MLLRLTCPRRAEVMRELRRQPYHWPQVLPRDVPAVERRTGPRSEQVALAIKEAEG